MRTDGHDRPSKRPAKFSRGETALTDASAVDRTAPIGGATDACLWGHANTRGTHTGGTDARGANDGRAGDRTQHNPRFCDTALRHADILAIDDGIGIGRRGHGQEDGSGKGNRGKGAVQISLP